ncbi:MAG TPA: Sir2 family NAD-dependent protein deacetylase [Nocardioidaceae bacterium]|nr:Sir2 family NAD-dependent protein deacetylase [Nocardioidaceae bacterium]
MTDLDRAAELIALADDVAVLTGAGISTESGIPDFRGPQGVWTKDPAAQAMFTIDNYLADREVRVRAWRNRRDHPAWSAKPNEGHRALVDLERHGRLTAIVTQNIDGLHQAAGSSPERVHEIHGTIWDAVCMTCQRRTPMADVLARVDAGEDDPPCQVCDGIQKSATISFGQALDADVLDASVDAARRCDLFVAVGTSLQVQPAASLCGVAINTHSPLVVVNAEPTPYDEIATAVIRDPIGEALPRLVGG